MSRKTVHQFRYAQALEGAHIDYLDFDGDPYSSRVEDQGWYKYIQYVAGRAIEDYYGRTTRSNNS